MTDCEHSRDPANCWECDDERADEAAWRALPGHVRAWRRLKVALQWLHPLILLRRLWFRCGGRYPMPLDQVTLAIRRWRHNRRGPTRTVDLTDWNALLKEHYSADVVRSLANAQHPLLSMLTKVRAEDGREWVTPVRLTHPVYQGVASLPDDDYRYTETIAPGPTGLADWVPAAPADDDEAA